MIKQYGGEMNDLIKENEKAKFEIECIITHPECWLYAENIQAALKEYFKSDSFKVKRIEEEK